MTEPSDDTVTDRPDDTVIDGPRRRATPEDVEVALAASAGLGMFFRLADPRRGGTDWQPVGLLYASRSDAIDTLLDDTVARLGGCERRVAASLLFQGYVARLLSPQVGCLVTSACVPAVPAAGLRWRRPDAEVLELGLVAGAGWCGPADVLTEVMLSQSFDWHLHPLAVSLRARIRIPASVLRDNAASALIGALRLADDKRADDKRADDKRADDKRADDKRADDKRMPSWQYLAELALADPRLRGAGVLGPDEPGFVRRSCCLYYRVDAGGMCGDCPLA